MGELNFDFSQRLQKIKDDFDRSFSSPLSLQASEKENLLSIQVGKNYFAFKVSEILWLLRYQKVLALSNDAPGFLGVAGLQGRLVPVYDLAFLLGSEVDGQNNPAWFIVCGKNERVGLAFSDLREYISPSKDEIQTSGGEHRKNEHICGWVKHSKGLIQIVSVSSVFNSIKKRIGVGAAERRQII